MQLAMAATFYPHLRANYAHRKMMSKEMRNKAGICHRKKMGHEEHGWNLS